MFASYADVCQHLQGLGLFHMDLTLARVQEALRALRLTRLPFPVAQVAGTNGKGSTAAFLAALAQAHGLRVGLYTSPHFVRPEERIRINGLPLPAEQWPEAGNALMRAAPHLTYFEFLTVLALWAFVRAGVEVAVLEAGLGGRMDATTACPADVLLMTPIALDHEAVLGHGLAAIAADKAAAMRPGELVFSAAQSPEAWQELSREAQAKGCRLHSATETPPDTPLGLAGPHQRVNAGLALAAWPTLAGLCGTAPTPQATARGLRRAFVPGRLQHCPARAGSVWPAIWPDADVWLDGAHNPHGMRALRAALAELGVRPAAVVFSCLADKAVGELLPLVADIAGQAPVLAVSVRGNARAASAAELAAGLRALGRNARVPEAPDTEAGTLPAALATLAAAPPPGAVLVCGSLYLLGEVFALYPHYLAPGEMP